MQKKLFSILELSKEVKQLSVDRMVAATGMLDRLDIRTKTLFVSTIGINLLLMSRLLRRLQDMPARMVIMGNLKRALPPNQPRHQECYTLKMSMHSGVPELPL